MMLQLVSSQEIQGTQSVCFPSCLHLEFFQKFLLTPTVHHSHRDFQFNNPQVVFQIVGIDPNAPISTCGNHLCTYIPHFSSFSRKMNLDTFQLPHFPFSLTCPSSRIAITIILQLLSFLSVIKKSGLLVPISWSFQTLKFHKSL